MVIITICFVKTLTLNLKSNLFRIIYFTLPLSLYNFRFNSVSKQTWSNINQYSQFIHIFYNFLLWYGIRFVCYDMRFVCYTMRVVCYAVREFKGYIYGMVWYAMLWYDIRFEETRLLCMKSSKVNRNRKGWKRLKMNSNKTV